MEEFDKKVDSLRARFENTQWLIRVLPVSTLLFDVKEKNTIPTVLSANSELQTQCGCHVCGKRALQKSDGDNEIARLRLTRVVLNENSDAKILAIAQLRVLELETLHMSNQDLLLADMCIPTDEGYLVCDDCVKSNGLVLKTCCECQTTFSCTPQFSQLTGSVCGKTYTICDRCADEWDNPTIGKCCHCGSKSTFNGLEFMMDIGNAMYTLCIDCVVASPTDEIVTTLQEKLCKRIPKRFDDDGAVGEKCCEHVKVRKEDTVAC